VISSTLGINGHTTNTGKGKMCNGGQVLISITQALNRGGGRTTEECEITHDQGDDRLTVIFPVESVTAQ